MRNSRMAAVAVVVMFVLGFGAGFAQAATPAVAPTMQAVQRVSEVGRVASIEAWAKRDVRAAGRSIAAATRYVDDGMSSAGRAVAHEGAKGLKVAASLGEGLTGRVTNGTEQAWTAITSTVHWAVAKIE